MTPAQLSADQQELLALLLAEEGADALPERRIPRRAAGGDPPLSFGQERLWFLQQMEPENPFYNLPAVLRLEGELDVEALERALAEIVRRHEVLRTTIALRDGAPVQAVAPPSPLRLAAEEVPGSGAEEREAELRRLIRAEAQRPFDLARGPLLRASLQRLDPREHVLLIVLHHVVTDGWSTGILLRELGTLYAAFARGEGSPLPELPIQYADFAIWQRERMAEALAAELGWWRERLAGAPALLELPTDRPRPAVQRHRGAAEPLAIPADATESLRALARAEGATLFMVLLAGWQLLLARYSGQDDVVVGTPVAGRTRVELEELIGFFVNMLPLRAELGGDPTVRELLARVQERTLEAYQHQELPFDRLVAGLDAGRGTDHAPVFQVTFALQNVPGAGLSLPGLRMRPLPSDAVPAKFDLALFATEGRRDLHLTLVYDQDLFREETAAAMLRRLGRLLEQMSADPDRRISRLSLLDEAERARVVDEWNRTASTYPREASIHALFARQAADTPDALALVDGGTRLTYRELEERANRLAHHLVAHGIAPDARVAVLLERSAELVVALLGILKAGGAYMPLDPGFPPERLRLMLDDADARILITRSELLDRLPPDHCAALVMLDAATDEIASRNSTDPAIELDPQGLAYVVYTSGSTGTPKGVAVPHRAVVRLVRDNDYVRITPEDRVAQASTATFDAATFEVWGALLNGAAVVVLPRDLTLALEQLVSTLRREQISALFLTTALFHQVAREIPDGFATLRHLLAGGEAIDAAAVRAVLAAGPPQRLLNVYGPTESTTFATWHLVSAVDEDAATVPIGRAIANTTAYVLDGAGQPAPVGVAGELYLGGDGLARGYLARPALTAARFVPDPFSAEPGARLYRTGDRVRWLPSGALEFVGRTDQQVKVRGFRIEPGEVEAALLAHPQIRAAVVVVREDGGEKRLVGYVVPADGAGPSAGELREHLRQRLPEYMVPAAFVPLDALPLNANGKVDRRALPAPEYAAEAEFAEPRTPTEELLAGIFAEVLGVERVGRYDGFFELGGHSLLATRVVSRVRQSLAIELPLRAIFEHPTVAALAERVEDARQAAQGLALPPITRSSRSGDLPLSFAQERLWLLDRLAPGNIVYNVTGALRLEGELDAEALERALSEIVRRHEVLRTTFALRDGAPVQLVAPPAPLRLAREDVADEAEVRRRVRAEAQRPFDLARGPLLRTSLLRVDDREHVLLLSMHHIVTDGWSMGILLRELATLYAAFARGEDSPLAELPIQYGDYAVWQREHLAGALDPQLAWWRERLAGAPALLDLPTDRPRPAVQSHRGAVEPFALPRETAEQLRALARAEGATLFMVLLAAWQLLLARYSGQEDVVVGTPVAGRTRGEVEGLIGFFVNTLALRTDLSGAPSFRALLARVREGTLGAYAHQDLPFERLVEAVHPERSLDHSPLFQVMLVLQNAPGAAAELPGLRLRALERESQVAKFDLTLFLAESGGGLAGVLEYATALFDDATARRMLAHFRIVLEHVARDPAAPLHAISLLGEAERRQLVLEWNDTAAEYPRDLCVHDLFRAQAARTPAAVAVEHCADLLTYAELDRWTDRLARRLRGLGVEPEVRVGIFIDRSPEMVAAVLAVLKAGGAYVPLDPGYPAERLAWLLADSAAPVLLTTARGRDRLPPHGARMVTVERETASAATDPLPSTATPGNLAYVIFTSGSTGRPKGVAVPHRGVVSYLSWASRAYHGARGGALLHSPLAFDLTVTTLFVPLISGERVVLAPEGDGIEPIAAALARRDFGLVKLTPTHLALLSRQLPAGTRRARILVVGGEDLPAELAARWHAVSPGGEIVNEYGPTETVVGCCVHTAAPGDASGSVPIGRPIANARLYVADARMGLLPAGAAGELLIGGEGVARGYLGRPALTAERFVPDPFGAEPGARLYRTGDRARRRADGTLEFLGRLDHQLKVRGYRVEPGEIEAALLEHPGVSEAVVIAREDAPGDRRLVGYVVSAGGASTDELRNHLRARLPEHMVPAAIVALDALPLTPNGKLDRRALPAPEYGGGAAAYVAPEDALERAIAEVWCEVLGAERVGAEDNFFDLGGNSLLLVRVHDRLARTLGREVEVVDLFRHSTVRRLARHLRQGSAEEGGLRENVERAQARRVLLQQRGRARNHRE